MKKSILTFALFSLVVLTSFTTLTSPNETGDDDDTGTPTTTTDRNDSGGAGGGSAGQNVGGSVGGKKDIVADILPVKMEYTNIEGQNINIRNKSDF